MRRWVENLKPVYTCSGMGQLANDVIQDCFTVMWSKRKERGDKNHWGHSRLELNISAWIHVQFNTDTDGSIPNYLGICVYLVTTMYLSS
jgi:hypothetical protein